MRKPFDPKKVQQLGETYKKKVKPEVGGSSRGGCMKAVYIGLGSLFGERYGFRGEFHKNFFKRTRRIESGKNLKEGQLNTIDRVFRALENEGIAFAEQKFTPANGKWERNDGTVLESLEKELVEQARGFADGSHFFGVAASQGFHSLLLRLHKAEDGSVSIFWMDQFSDGFDKVRARSFVISPNVTGSLDQAILKFGNQTTSVWLLNSEMAANT